jgi:hypothetical protein
VTWTQRTFLLTPVDSKLRKYKGGGRQTLLLNDYTALR